MSILSKLGKSQGSTDNMSLQHSDNSHVVGTTSAGKVVVSHKVDWKFKGVQDAGAANGHIDAFINGHQSTWSSIRQSQALDNALQEKMKIELQQDITNYQSQKNNAETALEIEQGRLDSKRRELSEKQNEISEVKDGRINADRTLKLNLRIGTVIIVMMTIYLFLFYSSTTFSAFIRDWDIGDTLQVAMFDGQAIPHAFKAGLFEGMFVLLLPVIFMALGYVADQIGKDDKAFLKYAKTIGMYTLTFAFDFLLAYKISRNIYNIENGTLLEDTVPYSVKIAVKDIDFWIVIFCGFVSYVIWGLVFSFVMKCYNRITSSRHIIESLRRELDNLQNDFERLTQNVSNLKNKVNDLTAKINQKQLELTASVRYDFDSIRKGLSDYSMGWISYCNMAGLPTDDISNSIQLQNQAVEVWISDVKNKYKQTNN